VKARAEPRPAESRENISPDSVRRQVQRILASPGFSRSERLGSFLRFVVEETLQGHPEQLKETVIGTAVYDKEADYDPKATAVVRVEAAKLRARLGEYYAGPGRSDAVVIEIPKGGYAPVWTGPHAAPVLRRRSPMLVLGATVALAAIGIGIWLSVPRRPTFSSIVVLPFLDLSRDHSDEYFSDGLTEQIIDALANVEKLRVISQTSSFALKGKQLGIWQIRDMLHVDAVVEGSVRRQGDQLRITAQFVNARDDRHLWSHTFDREIKDLFAIQDDIARSILETVRAGKPAESSPAAGMRYTQNLEVYNLYLKGRYFWDKFEGEKARSFFEQVIAKDPGYAPAYAGIADCYQRFPGDLAPQVAQTKVKWFAETALQLDPRLAEAHAVLGKWSVGQYDWPGAERRFLRAIELNPNLPEAHQWYGRELLPVLGRMPEGLREIRRAEELDPLSANVAALVSDVLRRMGRVDEAIAQARKAVELDPNSRRAHGYLGMAYLEKKMYTEGLRESETWLMPGSTAMAWAYAAAGRRTDALRILDQLLQQPHQNWASPRQRDVSPAEIARVYNLLGDTDRAFQWLDKAYDDHDGGIIMAVGHPDFASLRTDPRYVDLVRKLRLPR
jgi:TolB-like protein/Tfp pilus assembly protein PilF